MQQRGIERRRLGVDRPAAARLIDEIRAQGVSVLLTEREPAVAKTVADRVARLERGAIVG